MKVLAKTADGTFICEVNNTEVEKFMGKYYGNMKKLEAGQSIDLGAQHDFEYTTRQALEKTQAFIEANGEVIKAITDGIKIINFGDNGGNGVTVRLSNEP